MRKFRVGAPESDQPLNDAAHPHVPLQSQLATWMVGEIRSFITRSFCARGLSSYWEAAMEAPGLATAG